jgi:hypothetical protein
MIIGVNRKINIYYSPLTMSLPCDKSHVGEVDEDEKSLRPEVEGEQQSTGDLDIRHIYLEAWSTTHEHTDMARVYKQLHRSNYHEA